MNQRRRLEVRAADQERPHRQGHRSSADRIGYRHDERRGVGEALPRRLGEAPIDDLRQPRRGERRDGARGRRGRGDVQGEERFVRSGVERQSPRERVIRDTTQRIDVAASVHGVTARLFGTHECRRTDHMSPRRRGTSEHPVRDPSAALMRDRKVGEQRATRERVQENVVGFDVAMNDTPRVRVIERFADVAEQAAGQLRIQWSQRRDAMRQCLAVRASLRSRRRHDSSAARSGDKTLSATRRSSRRSRARYTRAIPPRPRGPRFRTTRPVLGGVLSWWLHTRGRAPKFVAGDPRLCDPCWPPCAFEHRFWRL